MSSPTSRSASPTSADIERFLRELHGADITDLEPLSGGFWSRAVGYRIGEDELVARFGEQRDGFVADRDAMAFASPDLPVPEVLDIGDAFGASYAISRRHHGRFLEDMGPEVAPALHRLLDALRRVPATGVTGWRDGLLERLVIDQPPGWREKLRAHPHAEEVFERAAARLRTLVPSLPERSDLLHGDLLHANVLVAEDASSVNAVFSWKCSVRGDHLYDVAWCTFWGRLFHPGISAAMADVEIEDAGRHHCYELHIGATHIGWNAWVGDEESLALVTDEVSRLTALA